MHNTSHNANSACSPSEEEYKISFFWRRDFSKSLHSVAVFILLCLCVFSFPRRPIQHFISPQCQYHIVFNPVTALP